jgi:hypothetical protein
MLTTTKQTDTRITNFRLVAVLVVVVAVAVEIELLQLLTLLRVASTAAFLSRIR